MLVLLKGANRNACPTRQDGLTHPFLVTSRLDQLTNVMIHRDSSLLRVAHVPHDSLDLTHSHPYGRKIMAEKCGYHMDDDTYCELGKGHTGGHAS